MRTIDDCAKKVRWKSNVVQATGTTALGVVRFVHAAMPFVAMIAKPGEGNRLSAPALVKSSLFTADFLNMGHNDIDYELKTGKELSFTFENETQNRLILDSLLWLGGRRSNP